MPITNYPIKLSGPESYRLADMAGVHMDLRTVAATCAHLDRMFEREAESKERIPMVREELLASLRRAEIMTSDKSNSVKLTFAPNQVLITANTPEVGEGKETISVNYKGKEFSIAFNPVYLMDPLKALEPDEVYLELIDELSPGVIKIGTPFLYVLMPMRIS